MNSSFVKTSSFWFVLLVFGLSTAMAENTLIFSTSHSNISPTDVKQAEGVLKIQVSSFSPIVEIRVNDQVQATQNQTSAKIEVPYQLSVGENRFLVLVKTEEVEKTKEFVLKLAETMEKPAKKAKKPFQLILLGGIEQTDNATSVKDDKEADMKTSLMVIPRYKLPLKSNSNLLLQGVLLREKYANSDLASTQIEYTQVGANWFNRSGFGDWQVDLGWTDIGSTTAADATRADVESDIYIGGSVRLNALDKKNVSLGLKYTLKNAGEPVSEDHDGDGGALVINAAWDRKIDKIKGQLKAGIEQNSAKGKYQNYSATNLGVKGDYPLNKQMVLSGLFNMKQTAYSESDPLKGGQESTTLNTIAIKGSYKIPQVKGLIGMAAVTQKQQSSNIASKEYSTLLIGLSVIYVY